MAVGLLGGSFNPAHGGHLSISRRALNQAGLDRLFWLVSPQNPLKDPASLLPMAERLARAQDLAAQDRRIIVTDLEQRLGLRYTVETQRLVRRRHRGVHFVLVMGSDNLLQLPQWRSWREIVALMPLVAAPRPGTALAARRGWTAAILRAHTLDSADARLIARRPPPALVFLDGPQDRRSASRQRAGERP